MRTIKHYLNVCDINGANVEPVDVITFGSPCQDLSIAGKRAGLKHESNGDEETTRSGLFMEAVRIIKEMREKTNGLQPRFAVWENVPGAFSSNKGEDFRVVLEELAKVKDKTISMPKPTKGKWTTAGTIMGDDYSICWRTLDAQYHGVPQRRRRIYLVADFAGQCAEEILFKCNGLSGYSSQSRETEQGVATDFRTSIETTVLGVDPYNGCLTDDKSSTLGVNCGMSTGRQAVCIGIDTYNVDTTVYSIDRESFSSGVNFPRTPGIEENGVSPTLGTNGPGAVCYAVDQGGGKSSCNVSDNNSPTLTCTHGGEPAVCYGIQRQISNVEYEENKSPTILAAAGTSGNNQPAVCVLEGNGSRPSHKGNGYKESDKMYTLNTTETHAVCYGISAFESNAMKSSNPHSGIYEADTSRTLDLNGGNPACNQGGIAVCEPQLFEWHNQDSRIRPIEVGCTLNTNAGGREGHLVLEPVVESKTYRKTAHPQNAEQGQGWEETKTADTLNVFDNSKTRTPIAVCEPVAYSFDQGATRDVGALFIKECSKTITNGTCPGHHNGVVECKPTYCMTTGGFTQIEKEKSPCLMARDFKDPNTLACPDGTKYIVRRLTPTECARLQGFPDTWGHLTTITDMTDEDYQFWCDALKTHAEINGKNYKQKTKEQMIKWYNKLHTDSAEYKMWGNGVALPCTRVPMHGIAKLGAKTLGSLFDGSGGFPLAGMLDGIQPLWCSEIEPYPIAVTKERFN